MSGGRAWLFYVGIVLAVLGLALLLLAQAALGFYLGSALTIVGLILFGIGLRARLKASNPMLGNLVLIAAILSGVALGYLAYLAG